VVDVAFRRRRPAGLRCASSEPSSFFFVAGQTTRPRLSRRFAPGAGTPRAIPPMPPLYERDRCLRGGTASCTGSVRSCCASYCCSRRHSPISPEKIASFALLIRSGADISAGRGFYGFELRIAQPLVRLGSLTPKPAARRLQSGHQLPVFPFLGEPLAGSAGQLWAYPVASLVF